MYNSHRTSRWMIPVVGAMLIVGGIAGSASAAEQPGTPNLPSATKLDGQNCLLMRVGNQFVRCDNLTGAGAPAPSWIPEQ